MGVGFAIPSDSAKTVMDQLLKHGKVPRGLLGINTQDVTEGLAKSFGRSDTNGALVSQVVPGGPAQKAGVKAGDIVLDFDGRPVTGAGQLKNFVGQTKPGSMAKLTIWRNKKTLEISVPIIERTPQALPAAMPAAGSPAELGITVEKVHAAQASKLGLTEGMGLEVKELKPGETGAAIGLRQGDVILEVDDKVIQDVSEFNAQVAEAKKNGVIRMLIQRGSVILYLAEHLVAEQGKWE